MSDIQLLNHSQINKEKWDHCIDTAANGLIYGYSYYLDQMADHWDGLVLGDYEAVMPLTWNKKYGIKYLYQPFLAAQLGLFTQLPGDNIVQEFYDKLGAYKLIEISLNCDNKIEGEHIVQRSNYVLSLNAQYQDLYNNYRENIQRNIKKAVQAGLQFEKNISIQDVIALALLQMKSLGHTASENVARFKNLFAELQKRKMAATYGIRSPEGKLLASCVFFFSHRRAYYILVGNDPATKNSGASHALIDGFIKENAGTDLLLDFEGSDIPTLAFFYNGFGAEHQHYPSIMINRLPFFVRWLKK